MADEAWGVKRVCPETGKRFYDLNKNPIVSPYTGNEYELSFFSNDKSKTSMTDKADKANVAKATKDDLSDDADVLDTEDDAADVDLGDDVLDDSDDDDTVPLGEVADVAAPSDDS
ncbi:MAG: TIGR02300 family protein [Rhodobacteraceae bacterium]|nr:MAG: TIGR02300 family protein [Paracoccaceae bacterium]